MSLNEDQSPSSTEGLARLAITSGSLDAQMTAFAGIGRNSAGDRGRFVPSSLAGRVKR